MRFLQNSSKYVLLSFEFEMDEVCETMGRMVGENGLSCCSRRCDLKQKEIGLKVILRIKIEKRLEFLLVKDGFQKVLKL